MAVRMMSRLYQVLSPRLPLVAARLPAATQAWTHGPAVSLGTINPAFRHPVALLATVSKEKTAPKTVSITFIGRDGEEQTVQAKIGDSLLDVAKEFDIDVEGACEGTLSCSTCHMVVDSEWYEKIPDPLTEEEQDMLDLAVGLTDTSRLGCQILVSEELNGIRLALPKATRDIRNT